tara:strand:+ start:13061 stop:14206 length:1146 start_codon:yes stop_codon:yes gene_type:complete
MQNKTKYSLIFVISAFIIGTPAFFLLQAEENQALAAQADEILLDLSATNTIKPILAINNAPAPAAGIKPAITMNDELEAEPVYENPIDRIRAIQHKNELHESLIEDNEKFTRYPEYNQVFSESDKDPIAQRYEIDERTTQNKEDQSSLTIWSDKKYYLQGDQATIFASLRDVDGKPIPTQFIGQLIYNEKVSLQTVEFTDNNQDGIYEHSIPLNITAEQKLEAGLYKVLIVNKTNKISDAITFILSKPEIELTGNFKDSISEKGELLIQAEVSVSAKNRFYFQASLYSANNLPIGSTQVSTQLLSGKHWITLPFDGDMIKDMGESGPFLLKNMSLAKVTMPMQRAPMSQPEYFTNDYALNQFHSNQQTQSDKLQANNLSNQ